jgi:hypothetical protein
MFYTIWKGGSKSKGRGSARALPLRAPERLRLSAFIEMDSDVPSEILDAITRGVCDLEPTVRRGDLEWLAESLYGGSPRFGAPCGEDPYDENRIGRETRMRTEANSGRLGFKLG